ncbi:hypothetical protein [Brucella oryzae]|uniref:hypothetical protein n=1 Tax=Brucella oryzae TaxID=335286 RepID=UPI00142E128A|nr:hypothetical protein [Brucella oryzae]MBR7653171.1 hypothetical protein [Brucella oryzae]
MNEYVHGRGVRLARNYVWQTIALPIAAPNFRFVFTHYLKQSRFALLLEMLITSG